tara:strand:+ start:559 stop:861 length:303 start_codon:yes stop_codon:yes gene_type:complete
MKRKTYERNRGFMPGFKQKPLKKLRKNMGSMSWVAHLTEKGDEKELADYLLDHCSFKRKSAAETAAKAFINAQEEMEECQDNKSAQHVDTNTTDIQKQQR